MADADPQDNIGDAFRSCRDVTEKIDMLIFAVTELGDGRLGEKLKEWKDNQSRVGRTAAAHTASSIDEVKNMVGVESAEQARELVADARGEDVAKDLPDTAQGDAIEDQVVALPEGADAGDAGEGLRRDEDEVLVEEEEPAGL